MSTLRVCRSNVFLLQFSSQKIVFRFLQSLGQSWHKLHIDLQPIESQSFVVVFAIASGAAGVQEAAMIGDISLLDGRCIDQGL